MSRSRSMGFVPWVGAAIVLVAAAAQTGRPAPGAHAQSCPPRCGTPIVTPAWHLHMCDMSYEGQLDDGHCMQGDGVTEFADGTEQVYIVYCHSGEDLVVVQVKDAAGGLQYINHPDGMTYRGSGCESLVYTRRGGIRPSGSPYYTSAYWPEGPFVGVGRGIEWFVGLFVALDADAYYGSGAQAVLTARDPGASLDPLVTETILVRVASTSDPDGIDIELAEEFPDQPIFRSRLPLRFSTESSDPAAGVLHVSDQDAVTVSYCPRDCETPYSDDATWYQDTATVTPTSEPTSAVVTPTATATSPPEVRVETTSIRPQPADVGYVPQQSVNRDLVNHLGYPTMYVGMWTHGSNAHYGMVQFDLDRLPPGAEVIAARLELTGRDRRFLAPGMWSVKLLDQAIDAPWRNATFDMVAAAPVLAQVGADLPDTHLHEDEAVGVGFAHDQLRFVNDRLATTRKLSFRIDGPLGADNNVFGWHTGVDTYGRESMPPDPALGPVLTLRYTLGAPTATASIPAGSAVPTATVPTTSVPPGSAAPPTTATREATPSTTPSTTPFPSGPSLTPSATATGTLPTAIWTPAASGTSAVPSATVALTAGAATAEPTVAAAAAREVCLIAFDDRDGDGSRGASERFLAGVTVRLTLTQSGAFVSWTTDGQNDPDFCWSGLGDGDYVLAIVQAPHGYRPGIRSEHRFDVPLAAGPARFEFGLLRTPPPTTPTGPAPTPVTITPIPTEPRWLPWARR